MSLSQVGYIARKILRLKPYSICRIAERRLNGLWRRWKNPQRQTSYGTENRDKTFYVIGLEYIPATGLTWLIFFIFLHIIYAARRGYIPVVDMQNFENKFLDKKLLHKQNAWEYFFTQPAGYTLTDIASSQNIILSSPSHFRPARESIGPCLLDRANKKKLLYFRKLFQKYIRPTAETQKYFDNEYKSLLKNKPKVLGVLCRGTDYLLSRPPGHQIQPEPRSVLSKAREVMARQKCSHLYLATEDQDIYDLFKANFGSRLLANKQRRVSLRQTKNARGRLIHQFLPLSAQGKYAMNLAYFSSLNMLARCSCFVGGRTGGTLAVYLMTKGFDYEYTWDLGAYS
ncbi:MAG: hypothetical protein LBD99_05070 [Candidatus Margulisbacteria bacterium]|nr:hypothetical protein [Candidatus Margulisiibacteriota bacterium]